MVLRTLGRTGWRGYWGFVPERWCSSPPVTSWRPRKCPVTQGVSRGAVQEFAGARGLAYHTERGALIDPYNFYM